MREPYKLQTFKRKYNHHNRCAIEGNYRHLCTTKSTYMKANLQTIKIAYTKILLAAFIFLSMQTQKPPHHLPVTNNTHTQNHDLFSKISRSKTNFIVHFRKTFSCYGPIFEIFAYKSMKR